MNKLAYFLLLSSSTLAQKCGENSLPECPADYAFDTASLNCADEVAKTALTKAAEDLAAADKT